MSLISDFSDFNTKNTNIKQIAANVALKILYWNKWMILDIQNIIYPVEYL